MTGSSQVGPNVITIFVTSRQDITDF